MKISGGKTESGIVVGNTYDKYGSSNLLIRWIMQGFESSLSELIGQASPSTIHEIGCGEGYWVLKWYERGYRVRGCDFSNNIIDLARENAITHDMPPDIFHVRSIYDLEAYRDSADLIICCEVLEHLEHPHSALESLQRIVKGHLIVSVPREPIWRILNMARGQYFGQLGNTPGHIQHWSKRSFVHLISEYFEVLQVKTPLPWVMLLCRPHS